MRLLIVASRNPVKLAAVEGAFRRMFPREGFRVRPVAVPSGVRPQPMSDGETLEGSRGRAAAAAERVPEGDFWVGIEGGVDEGPAGMMAFAWVVVRGSDGEGGERLGCGRTGAFPLPPEVAQRVCGGMELGEADDLVFARSNSKQGDGAVGLLTGNVIDRRRLYEEAVVLALIPFANPELFPPGS